MHIYSFINVDCLRLFEPSLIEDPKEQSQLPSIDDLLSEYLNELQEDTVLDRKVRTMCKGDVEYLKIGLKGSKLSSAKWIEIGQVRQLYPQSMLENQLLVVQNHFQWEGRDPNWIHENYQSTKTV